MLAKMNGKNTRRTTLRKARVNAARLDSFVADYVKHKNIDMYNEAEHFYHMLRNRYPVKLNLKKTKEYECWKDNTEINLMPTQQETLQTQTVPPPPALEQTSTTTDEHPHADLSNQPEFNDTLQLRIPLMDVTNFEKEPTERIPLMDVTNIEKEPTERIPLTDVTNIEKEPTERIPLTDVTNTEKEPTETLEIIAEEVLSEDTIQPSLEEVISDELVEEIIKELQADPEINNIFSTLQEQIEFNELGMDIEIDDENLLEKELSYW